MTELQPGYTMKKDPQWGWTIAVDNADKQPCPMCIGEGHVWVDDGFDQDGNLTAEYQITCPRCLGKRTYKIEMEDDGSTNC